MQGLLPPESSAYIGLFAYDSCSYTCYPDKQKVLSASTLSAAFAGLVPPVWCALLQRTQENLHLPGCARSGIFRATAPDSSGITMIIWTFGIRNFMIFFTSVLWQQCVGFSKSRVHPQFSPELTLGQHVSYLFLNRNVWETTYVFFLFASCSIFVTINRIIDSIPYVLFCPICIICMTTDVNVVCASFYSVL